MSSPTPTGGGDPTGFAGAATPFPATHLHASGDGPAGSPFPTRVVKVLPPGSPPRKRGRPLERGVAPDAGASHRARPFAVPRPPGRGPRGSRNPPHPRGMDRHVSPHIRGGEPTDGRRTCRRIDAGPGPTSRPRKVPLHASGGGSRAHPHASGGGHQRRPHGFSLPRERKRRSADRTPGAAHAPPRANGAGTRRKSFPSVWKGREAPPSKTLPPRSHAGGATVPPHRFSPRKWGRAGENPATGQRASARQPRGGNRAHFSPPHASGAPWSRVVPRETRPTPRWDTGSRREEAPSAFPLLPTPVGVNRGDE